MLVGLPLLRAIIKGGTNEMPMNTHRFGLISAGLIVAMMAVVGISQLLQ